MTRKNIAYILATIAACVAVCYYVYTANVLYDGGLIDSLTPYFLNLPLIGGMSLYQILTKENSDEKAKSPLWQKILAWCIIVPCCVAVLWAWVDSRFYDVSCLIAVVLVVALSPLIYFEHKRGQYTKQPIPSWAVGYMAVYLLIATTVFTYVQVVEPITVAQATAMVEAEYGTDTYKFIAHLTGDRNETPLGVYWFANEDASLRDWLEIDILTGEIWTL